MIDQKNQDIDWLFRWKIFKLQGKIGALISILPFFVVVFCFLGLPAIMILFGSFLDHGSFSLANYQKILTSRYDLQAFINSIWLSVFSAILGAVIGVLASYAISQTTSWIRSIMIVITNLTSNFAGVPLAFAFAILFGMNGTLTVLLSKFLHFNLYDHFTLYSATGLALVYLYFQIPLATILIFPSFYGLKKEWFEASKNLGATDWQFWKYIGIPVIAPAVIASFVILFANAFGAYATAQALTTGTYNLVTIRLARSLVSEVNPNLNRADALAILMATIMFSSLVVYQKMNQRARRWLK